MQRNKKNVVRFLTKTRLFIRVKEIIKILVDGIIVAFLEFWNNWDLQFPFAGELIAKQSLTGAVVIVFFGHTKPTACSEEQVLLHTGSKGKNLHGYV